MECAIGLLSGLLVFLLLKMHRGICNEFSKKRKLDDKESENLKYNNRLFDSLKIYEYIIKTYIEKGGQ